MALSTSPRRWSALVAVFVAFGLCAPAVHAAGRIDAPLPAISRTEAAAQVRAADPRIEAARQRALRKAQQPAATRKSPGEAKIDRASRKLRARLARSEDRRPILVILEGPDGAGKSSTVRRLREPFEGSYAVREVHFGAPPPGETEHWLTSYEAELPREGEVVFWDRSYYGRTVYDPYYGMTDKATTRTRQKEITQLELRLKKDTRIVKLYLDARGDRLAQTIGKREAIAPEKLAASDYKTFADRKVIRDAFQDTMAHTGGAVSWHVLPMAERDEGRLEALKALKRELL